MKRSKEVRLRISIGTKAGMNNPIVRAKIINALKGKKKPPRTLEHCKNISKAKKGIKFSAEHCKSLSLGQLKSPNHTTRNKKRSSETIDKIRKARFNQKIPCNNTLPERIMEELLISLGIKYIPQYNIRFKTIADFFLPKYNIAIYCDGCYWHYHKHLGYSENEHTPQGITVKQVRQKDKQISHFLTKFGYTVFRAWECELKNKLEKVEVKLKELLIK